MKKEKRKRIVKVHKRTQKTLNVWKQEIIVALSNKLFTDIFPKSPFTKELLADCETDPIFKCHMSFKDLRINKPAIIQKLLCEGILPKDFYKLNTNTQCK